MNEDEDNNIFRLKAIDFGGRNVPILAQNANGPCPLLAIANVLLLRGAIDIHTDRPQISYEELVGLVFEYVLQANPLSEDPETAANQQHNMNDGMSMFPNLKRGIDVNVRFTGCDAFEFTAEQVIFDLCRVRMLHGWVVDMQDRETARVIGNSTYNQLIEKVIELNSLLSEETPPAQSLGESIEPQDSRGASAGLEQVAVEVAPSTADAPPPYTAVDAGAPAVSQSPADPRAPARGDDAAEEEAVQRSQNYSDPTAAAAAGAPAAGASFPPLRHPTPDPAATAAAVRTPQPALADPREDEKERVMRDGLIAQEFLNASANQLTYLGLVELHQCMRDNELCALFRNNHFSTILKHEGDLFVLITDLGYLHEQAVWEKLDQVDGNTPLCGPDFRVCDISERQQDHVVSATLGDVVPMSAHGLPEHLVSEEFLSRAAAQASAAGAGAEAGRLPPIAQAQPTAALMPVAAGGDPSDDGDLALAMQLQAEMDAESRREAQQHREAMAQANARSAQRAAQDQRGAQASLSGSGVSGRGVSSSGRGGAGPQAGQRMPPRPQKKQGSGSGCAIM